MLDVKNANSTIDFGKQLQPPPGYIIDYAVATTYSLDLYALLSIPLAMYYNQPLDTEVTEDNFQILEAIQNLQNHLKIFCQKGKISEPKSTAISLLAFIEKCVIEIAPQSPFESFHPKVWVLRFKAVESKDLLYRLIVMSRNLTFDKSYDIAYWMEGRPAGTSKPENSELVNLLSKLDKRSPFAHRKFIRDLERVEFQLSDHFSSYSFSSFPKGGSKQAIDLDTVYLKRLVVSPFLSNGMVAQLNEKSESKLIVFSRKEELDKLSKTVSDSVEAYYFSQEIMNHHLYENADDGEDDQYDTYDWNNNLHAKIFLRENKETTFWDLGSANCSDAAFERNHEFLLHLTSNFKEASIAKVKEELLSEYNGIRVFKPYERVMQDVVPVPEEDFRKLEYDLIHCLEDVHAFQARIESNNGNYDLILQLQFSGLLLKSEYTLLCKPLGVKSSLQEVKDNIPSLFTDIPLHKLSSFIHWQIRVNHTGYISNLVTKADISGMPDARLSNILRSIIDNPDKFMALILALLTEEPSGGFNDTITKSSEFNSFLDNPISLRLDMPIYEELLISLSRSPERLIRLASLIEKLSDSPEIQIVPKEFSRIWETIKEILLNGKMAR